MRSTNTFGIQFIMRLNKAKNNKAPIFVRITVDGDRKEISLKRWINVNDWNNQKGMAKGTREEIKSLNHYLESIKAQMVENYQKLKIQKKLVTADAIKDMFLGIDDKEYSLKKLMEYHNEKFKDKLAWGTMKNYHTTQKYILKFIESNFKRSEIYLSELRYKFIIDFEVYLLNHVPTDHQRRLTNNGAMKHLERLKKMIAFAVKMEWLNKDPFRRFKLKFKKVDRGYLDENELKVMEQKRFSMERLSYVRDIFVFSCYTGLAYIDIMNLTPENLSQGLDGEFWISTSRQKTDTPVKIPVLPKAYEIIEKYRNSPRSIEKGSLLPSISNQKLNSYLKEIADVCGIKKNLTFHLARHTFATTITLLNGVPIETVSKMLGHNKIATTQIYARVVEQKVSQDMKILKEVLNLKTKSEKKPTNG
ncbi:putative transposase [Indibacter alkaliphilus LW1]|uniref:Transposase n=1 Tax=Indibacter alkaliphilus (strain CCUG 57479 / KCTC 22604 / LW1) TaxID=1189612 RepID=S2DZW4_INDAL|nr:site-specific integrase [Indibacter alkaliphilus]EOZ95348.1 putative transposase [Indibacter alkaliphilus LW1]